MSFLKVKFFVEETIIIDSPKEKVWESITEPKNKKSWSPWIIMETETKQEFSGEIGKVGFKESWEGKITGTGNQEITEIKENDFIKSKLSFLKPFKSNSESEIELIEKGNSTKIIWKMVGELPVFLFFLKKTMSFFVGEDFKRGSLMLKDFTENGKLETKTEFTGEKKLEDKYYISLSAKSSFSELPKIMSGHYEKIITFLKENNIEPKIFFATYSKTDLVKDITSFESCAEVSVEDYEKISNMEKLEIILGKIESKKYICVNHTGDYKYLKNSWTAVFSYGKALKYKMNQKDKSLEIYNKSYFDNLKEDKFETEILVALK